MGRRTIIFYGPVAIRTSAGIRGWQGGSRRGDTPSRCRITRASTSNRSPRSCRRCSTGHSFDEDTVLVGHFGGAALLLALLQHLDVRIH